LPVYRYSYRKAVLDGYLIDQEPPIKIVTKLVQEGIYLGQGTDVTRLTNQGELIEDTLEDEQDFEVANFNRDIIASNFNKVVAQALSEELDPTGNKKTLIFCVNNMHADSMVFQLKEALKERYPNLEHDAIIKITGNSDKDPKKIQSMITRYNKERLPNIVVTVDLLSTGIDVPSICNLVFLRKVKSRILYEQMKGRATRLCPEIGKTSFKIYDAVDLYSTLESVDTMKPVVVRPKVSLNTLVSEISDPKTYQTTEADGRSFAEHSHEQLIAKVQRIVGQGMFNKDKSAEIEQTIKTFDDVLQQSAGCDFASLPKTLKDKGPQQTAEIFVELPKLVTNLEKLKTQINELRNEPIFTDIEDELLEMKPGYGEFDNPEDFLDAFDNLVSQSENSQAALHTVITKPKDLTRKALIQLQEWFDAQSFNESTLREAWKKTTNQDIAARLIGHIRRASLGDALLPFDQRVDNALGKILKQKTWTTEQISWLERLANSLKEQVALDEDTFKTGNYKRRGGKRKLEAVFNGELEQVLTLFNDYMWEQPA